MLWGKMPQCTPRVQGDEQKNLVEARSLRMAVTEAHSRDISCILIVKCLSGEDWFFNFTLHTVESHRGLLSMEVEVTEVVLVRCQKINCTSQILGQFFKQSEFGRITKEYLCVLMFIYLCSACFSEECRILPYDPYVIFCQLSKPSHSPVLLE